MVVLVFREREVGGDDGGRIYVPLCGRGGGEGGGERKF